MALDPVPWIIGGGALHSEDVARAMFYLAMGGREGIVGVESGKVSAGGGGNVSVGAGSFAIENTYPGGEGQMYAGREISSSLVAIPATGGTARSDMLVVYVEDPQFGGADPGNEGPFIKYGIISNVGSTATEVPGSYPHPALPLARIDLPASTSTITSGHIVDLRGAGPSGGVAGTPLYKKISKTYTPGAEIDLDAADPGEPWPLPAGWDIAIPEWATKVAVRATIGGIRVDNQTAKANYGRLWVTFGTITGAQTKYEHSEGGVNGSQNRITALAGMSDTVIPSAMRGTTQNLKLVGRRDGSAGGTNHLKADTTTTVFLDIEFFEEPA